MTLVLNVLRMEYLLNNKKENSVQISFFIFPDPNFLVGNLAKLGNLA